MTRALYADEGWQPAGAFWRLLATLLDMALYCGLCTLIAVPVGQAFDWSALWGSIDEIANAKLKSKSRQALSDAKRRYARLDAAMVKAESRMAPVLERLRDYVLYLKHNLNAQAIGALKREVGDIETEVGKLIQDISQSVKEADDFLKGFE